jgi:putative membrane protein
MRFKIKTALLALAAIMVIRLSFLQQLNLYIHPRYIIFTIVMTCIATALIAIDLTRGTNKKTKLSLSVLPLIIVLFFGLGFPAKSLTSSTVNQRLVEGTKPLAASGAEVNEMFANSSRSLSLEDWTRVIAASSDDSYFANKPAKISGFVYGGGSDPNTFSLSRFLVTCCAIDAQPIGVNVYAESWKNQFEEDQWLEVEGEFKSVEGEILLIPNSITKIEEPDNPYAN